MRVKAWRAARILTGFLEATIMVRGLLLLLLLVLVVVEGVGMAGVVRMTLIDVAVGGGGSIGFAIVLSGLWGAILSG
jgi:hypothetical protein